MPTATATRPTTGQFLGVELVRVGNWPASQGDGNVTAEDIASMATAYSDPARGRIPIKIGHLDSRFQGSDGQPPADADGNPAYGRVENVRASEDGQTLIGDLVNMPSQLADIAESAYPDRSVEFVRGRRLGGKTHRAVLTAVALLGETPPAVTGLNDLYAQFAAQLEQSVVLHIVDDTPTIHHSQRNPADGAGSTPTRNPGGPVPISAAVRTALAIPDDATDDQINETLVANGLPAIPAAAPVAAPVDAPVATTPAPAPAVTPTADAAPTAPELPVAASADVITVDRVSFSALQADAQAGRLARNEQIAAQRDGLVNTAVREGRIHPTVVSHYRAMLDTDHTNTANLLRALPPVLPTAEVGHANTANLSADDVANGDARAIATFVRR